MMTAAVPDSEALDDVVVARSLLAVQVPCDAQ